jgi:hypothetical protein
LITRIALIALIAISFYDYFSLLKEYSPHHQFIYGFILNSFGPCIVIKIKMRKHLSESPKQTIPLTVAALKALQKKGYQFVQVKAFSSDKHFDYVDPRMFIMVPVRELPVDSISMEIYEPIESELLKRWAEETDDMTQFLIAV